VVKLNLINFSAIKRERKLSEETPDLGEPLLNLTRQASALSEDFDAEDDKCSSLGSRYTSHQP
jgi:hypothetical protein